MSYVHCTPYPTNVHCTAYNVRLLGTMYNVRRTLAVMLIAVMGEMRCESKGGRASERWSEILGKRWEHGDDLTYIEM